MMSSPTRCLASLAVLLILAGAGCRAERVSTEPFPGMQLRARLETHLQNQRTVLRETLEHYALLFDDVGQEDLKAYLRPVQFFWLWATASCWARSRGSSRTGGDSSG
jgi:hypothetical protein